jgi:hypothetical protein
VTGWPADVPATDLVNADQVREGDRVVALALQMPHVVTAAVPDGPSVRLSFAPVTVSLGATTPVRRVQQTPAQRDAAAVERDLADAVAGMVRDAMMGQFQGSLVFIHRDGRESRYPVTEGGFGEAGGAVLSGPDGRLYDVRVTVDVTARPPAADS